MKLWLLKRRKGLCASESPWIPSYDKAKGFIIRAESCGAARSMASARAIDEGSEAWLDKRFSTCEEITEEGDFGILLESIHDS